MFYFAALLAAPAAWDATAGAAEPIRLGHFGSLSGSKAAFGDSTDQGIRLAVAEANARGGVLGRRVVVVTEDDQSNPDQVLPSVLALIDREGADVLLGEVSSTLTLIAAPLCQERAIPMVTPSSTAAAITRKGDYIFRVCFTDAYQGHAAALFARRDLKAGRAAVLVDQSNDYSLGFAQAFGRLFEALGGRVVASRTYREGDRDFKSQLSAIQAAGPDLLVIPAMYNDVPGIAQQARGLGLDCPLLGGDGWDAIETARIGGRAVEGAYFLTHYAPDQPTPEVRAFARAFMARFGRQPPDGIAALGYDAARIVLDAIRRAGTTEHRAVRDALARTRDFRGVTGTITMDAERNPTKSAMVIQIRDGAFHLDRRIEPGDVIAALGALEHPASSRGGPSMTAGPVLQQLVNGLGLGAIYGLIAIGYTIVYGILRLINFAHGDVFMLGAVFIVVLAGPLGLATLPGGPVVAIGATIATAMALCGLVGLALERLAYRPLRRPYGWPTILAFTIALPAALGVSGYLNRGESGRLLGIAAAGTALYGLALASNRLAARVGVGSSGRLDPLITAIGASLFLEYATQQRALFGNRPRGFPAALTIGNGSAPFRFGGLVLDRADVLVMAITAALVAVLALVVRHSRLGLAMRAVSEDPDAAVLMGIDPDRVVRFSFVLGGSLAGAAGVLWAMKYPSVDPLMGLMPGLKAFVAAVLGGIGSLPGAVLGGLLMGVCESFLAAGPLSEYKDALAFLLLIAVLLIRPAGLLGRNVPEKV